MPREKKLSDLGEFGLIDRISASVMPGAGVITGIGDDAAVTAPTPGMQLLASTDMLLEDVHFRLAWHNPYLLGRKSLAVNISDIAAMGGIPRWTTLSLALPSDFPLDLLDEFSRGFLAMAGEHGVTLIGGDTCSSRGGLVVSVTIMGEQRPELIVRRSGARPGDHVWVTGTLGDAALGLMLLEGELTLSGHEKERDYLLSRLLDPSPRVAIGRVLAESGLVSAMIDISDGLLADVEHIARLSGAGADIHLGSLPRSPAFCSVGALLPTFPSHLPLTGGEDYELAFAAPPEHREKIADIVKKYGIDAVPVGIVTARPGVRILTPDGTQLIPERHGFTHFH
jgi:thiamine-monophosphate kinase